MSTKGPTFAIMGSGGVGGYFGARLAQAGHPVSFIARGAHLRAIKDNGLHVADQGEPFVVDVQATDRAGDIGPVDFVLFSVKLWDTQAAGLECKALIGPQTAVLSLQNGVDSEEILMSLLGKKHVLGGVAELSAFISEPGHIEKMSPFHLIRFGEMDGRLSERTEALRRCLSESGIDVDLCQDIVAKIWQKFIFLTGLSSLTALTRKPIGEVRDDPDTRALLEEVMAETFTVARAQNINIADDVVADRMDFIDTLPPEVRASMAVDLNHGRRLELPWLSGTVVRLGLQLGVPTPASTFVATALKLHINGADGKQNEGG